MQANDFLIIMKGLGIPDEKLHGFYLDIQPTMGISLLGRIRMQLNLKIERSKILNDIPLNEGIKLIQFLYPTNPLISFF